MNTRLPLSPYCNPLPAHLRQPRCFPPQNKSTLSLFCKHGFQKRYLAAVWPYQPTKLIFFPRHVHSRQATLHTAHDSVHRLAGSYPARTRRGFPIGSSQLRRTKTGSPRKTGRMLHAIGARPKSLTPSIPPKLGVKSRPHGLHRYALHRIFWPYLEIGHSD